MSCTKYVNGYCCEGKGPCTTPGTPNGYIPIPYDESRESRITAVFQTLLDNPSLLQKIKDGGEYLDFSEIVKTYTSQSDIDAAMFADMQLQLNTAQSAIVYWQSEAYKRDLKIFELQHTLWQRFRRRVALFFY